MEKELLSGYYAAKKKGAVFITAPSNSFYSIKTKTQNYAQYVHRIVRSLA